MATQDYVTLNGKRYVTPFRQWFPVRKKPNRLKYTLGGTPDVTYGPALPVEWRGKLKVPVSDTDSDMGDITDFRTAVALKTAMPFVDHYGDAYTVHLIGEFTEDTWLPVVWSALNTFYIPVRLVKVT